MPASGFKLVNKFFPLASLTLSASSYVCPSQPLSLRLSPRSHRAASRLGVHSRGSAAASPVSGAQSCQIPRVPPRPYPRSPQELALQPLRLKFPELAKQSHLSFGSHSRLDSCFYLCLCYSLCLQSPYRSNRRHMCEGFSVVLSQAGFHHLEDVDRQSRSWSCRWMELLHDPAEPREDQTELLERGSRCVL